MMPRRKVISFLRSGMARAILLSFWGEQQAVTALVVAACTIFSPCDRALRQRAFPD